MKVLGKLPVPGRPTYLDYSVIQFLEFADVRPRSFIFHLKNLSDLSFFIFAFQLTDLDLL